MEQDKKPTASPPPAVPTAAPVPRARMPRWRQLLRVTRETRLGLVVAGCFIALVAGVLVVKNFFKPELEAEPPKQVTQAPPTPPTELPLKPLAFVEPPTVIPARADIPFTLEPPPVLDPPLKQVPPLIIEQLNIHPRLKNDPPLVLDPPPVIHPPEVVDPIVPPIRPANDDFSSPTQKDPPVVLDPPLKKDPLDAPPPPEIEIKLPPDPLKPEAKLIRIGSDEPKKDGPPKLDPPLVIDPPPVLDPPLIKDPPLVIDPPLKKEPPLVIDPPMKKEPALEVVPKVDGPKTDGGYDEDLHTLKPNETYRSLSKQYYNSDAYAVALQRYNRDHPGRADYVRVPPIWVLEKKYAADVTGGAARTNYAPPPAADLTPRAEPTYTVAENGEMLADIAKKALGSEESWKRIWDMNPQLNPAKLVPGGTRLRLPQ